jgi:hypothetical protein
MTLMKSRRRIVDLAFDTAITAGIRARQNSFGGLFAQQQLRAGNIRFTPKSRHSLRQLECPPWADAVEKGKNELIKIFACAPVETDFS